MFWKELKKGWQEASEEIEKEEKRQKEIENEVYGKKMTFTEAKAKWIEYMANEHYDEVIMWIEEMNIKLK